MERRRFLIVKRRVKGQPPLAGIFKGEQPLNSKPRPPAPIKNQPVYWRFFPGPMVQRTKCAEPSLAETKCIANDLLYRKISHCLVHSQAKNLAAICNPVLNVSVIGLQHRATRYISRATGGLHLSEMKKMTITEKKSKKSALTA